MGSKFKEMILKRKKILLNWDLLNRSRSFVAGIVALVKTHG